MLMEAFHLKLVIKMHLKDLVFKEITSFMKKMNNWKKKLKELQEPNVSNVVLGFLIRCAYIKCVKLAAWILLIIQRFVRFIRFPLLPRIQALKRERRENQNHHHRQFLSKSKK